MFQIRSICIVLTLLATLNGSAQSKSVAQALSNYNIHVTLDTTNKKLYGQTSITWTNPSDDSIDEVYFHLYYNAFKNTESTFFSDDGDIPDFLSTQIDEVCGWGWSNIDKILDSDGNDLTNSIAYVQPDDQNTEDKSVVRCSLDSPIAPRSTIALTLEWTAKIPNTMPRTGYNKEFYFFAQWFPKLGVYEPAGMRGNTQGRWNCHQYHGSGEYYSDFSNYELTMEVPHDFIIASSGSLQNKTKQDSSTVWTFQADNVIDVTWAASPHFIKKTIQHNDIELNFYTYPYKEHVSERYFSTLRFCIDFLKEHLAPYPYPTLTIIDPPIHGLYTGGMEYPTLITSISFNFFPPGFRTPETLVTHEYIHQYFMQMVASHEVEEPWLDEGFTTYWEARILDSLFNENNSMICLGGVTIGNKEYNRSEFLNSPNPKIAAINTRANQFEFGGYGPIAYNKSAVMLQTLEGLIGQSTMDNIWKEYFTTWQFKHPHSQDFIDVVNTQVAKHLPDLYPEGMDWYFEQVLYGTNECDYAVASVDKVIESNKRGFFENLENCEIIDSIESEEKTFEVTLHRLGEIKLPIDIQVTFTDGHQESYQWDGRQRGHQFLVTSDQDIVSVTIDPDRKIYLDKNFINNSKVLSPNNNSLSSFSRAFTANIQHILESLNLIF